MQRALIAVVVVAALAVGSPTAHSAERGSTSLFSYWMQVINKSVSNQFKQLGLALHNYGD